MPQLLAVKPAVDAVMTTRDGSSTVARFSSSGVNLEEKENKRVSHFSPNTSRPPPRPSPLPTHNGKAANIKIKKTKKNSQSDRAKHAAHVQVQHLAKRGVGVRVKRLAPRRAGVGQ